MYTGRTKQKEAHWTLLNIMFISEYHPFISGLITSVGLLSLCRHVLRRIYELARHTCEAVKQIVTQSLLCVCYVHNCVCKFS